MYNSLQPECLAANSIQVRKSNQCIVAKVFPSVFCLYFHDFFAELRLYILMKSEKMKDA